MCIPKLVRIRRKNNMIVQFCDIYIGRANSQGGWNLSESKWHNPFTIKQFGSAEKACELYLTYIINSKLFHDLPELESKTLGCWCDPPKNYNDIKGFYCHGCVLIQLFRIVKYHNYDTVSVQKMLKEIFN